MVKDNPAFLISNHSYLLGMFGLIFAVGEWLAR